MSAAPMPDHWQACASQLESEMPPQLFKTWIKPLVFLGYDESERTLRVGAQNHFKLNWVRAQYGARIAELAARELDPDVQSVVRAGQPAGQGQWRRCRSRRRRAEEVSGPGTGRARAGAGHRNSRREDRRAPSRRPQTILDKSRLRPDLTFDNFVTGKANQMARATALQVVEQPGTVQPAVPVRRRRPGQDPPDPRRRQRHPRARPGGARALHPRAGILRRDGARASSARRCRGPEALLPVARPAADRRHPVPVGKERTQEEFFYTFDALSRGAQADHHHLRHLPEGDLRPRGAADLALRLGADRRDRTARARDARRDPAEEGRAAGDRRSPRTSRSSSPSTCARTCASSKARCCAWSPTRAFATSRSRSTWPRRRSKDLLAAEPAPDLDRVHPEDRRRLLQDEGRRHVRQAAPAHIVAAAADRDVPREGAHAEEPARDRRGLRRPRPHDGAARGRARSPNCASTTRT